MFARLDDRRHQTRGVIRRMGNRWRYRMPRTLRMLAILFTLGLILAACTAGPGDDQTPAASGQVVADLCDDPPEPPAEEEGEIGGSISILAVYADAEQEAFM